MELALLAVLDVVVALVAPPPPPLPVVLEVADVVVAALLESSVEAHPKVRATTQARAGNEARRKDQRMR